VPLSKTTTRAIAASIALVAAGATVAGAAVFHLPMFGFGPTATAGADAAPARPPVAPAHKVRPRVIVRTRYVDDIVHRPAPRASRAPSGAPPSAPPAAAPAPNATQPVSGSTAPAQVGPSIEMPRSDDVVREPEERDHEAAEAGGQSSDTEHAVAETDR
jgi:hypothetical protein